jgi:Transposase domain (DUF772)
MLAVADRQVGMFDAGPLCEGLVAEGSFYALLAEHGDRIVSDGDFADCYSETTGRPSIPPSLLAEILLLQYREGLSDERAMEAVRLHLGWKVASRCRSITPAFTPLPWSSSAPGCCSRARSAWRSSARSSWQWSWG